MLALRRLSEVAPRGATTRLKILTNQIFRTIDHIYRHRRINPRFEFVAGPRCRHKNKLIFFEEVEPAVTNCVKTKKTCTRDK